MNRRVVRRAGYWILLAFVPTVNAYAKRVGTLIPLPYPTRVVRGLIGLVPLAAILVAICVIAIIRVARPAKPALHKFLLSSSALVIAGSLVAACDAANDEWYEPWFLGSFFIALIPAVATRLSYAHRWSKWLTLAAIASAVPVWFVFVLASILVRGWLIQYVHASW